ncbi:hypothetical protein [Thermospira aquatica]|uniref:Uncharacterized protein n=1 Tax=Thermospira aquatica TaxID=2828656 RepID=A0AAX3BDB1_9SPIR|nr:hypothetical protein [Thermospira aquatica]URA10297.1 hypothetical protein KDW03_00385 [Thermospira aquatica]
MAIGEKKSRSFPVTVLIFLFLVVTAGGYLVLQYWRTYFISEKIHLDQAIENLTREFLLSEISIQETSPALAGQLIFYDSQGRALHSEAFEMGGTDLYVEFLFLSWSYGTNTFVFGYPLRVYSDVVAPADGVEVFDPYTNRLFRGGEIEKLAYFLVSGKDVEEVTIQKRDTIALHQYPGKSWQKGRYEVIYRQNGTVELREK